MIRMTLTDPQWAIIAPHCLGRECDPGRTGPSDVCGGSVRCLLLRLDWECRRLQNGSFRIDDEPARAVDVIKGQTPAPCVFVQAQFTTRRDNAVVHACPDFFFRKLGGLGQQSGLDNKIPGDAFDRCYCLSFQCVSADEKLPLSGVLVLSVWGDVVNGHSFVWSPVTAIGSDRVQCLRALSGRVRRETLLLRNAGGP